MLVTYRSDSSKFISWSKTSMGTLALAMLCAMGRPCEGPATVCPGPGPAP